MTQILDLSDRIFKITIINMLRVLAEKMDNLQEEMDNVSRNRNFEKEYKRSARNQKHCNKNGDCFG